MIEQDDFVVLLYNVLPVSFLGVNPVYGARAEKLRPARM